MANELAMWTNNTVERVERGDILTTFTDSVEDKKKTFNALQGTFSSLSEAAGKTLEVHNVLISKTTMLDEETGEEKMVPRTVLETNEGVFSSYSKLVASSAWLLTEMFDMPVKIRVKQNQSGNNRNYKYVTIEVA